MEGRKRFAALMVLVGAGNAAAQTGGWLLVRNAIDQGITPGNERHLTIVVIIYLGVAAVGWWLQAHLIRGLAKIGQAVVIGLRRGLFDHLTSLSLRYFSQQKAGWIIARITSDVDAVSDTLSQGMPTLLANVILLPAAVDRAAHRRLAPRAHRVRRSPAGAHPLALVPACLARRERRAAQHDRRGDGADRRVGGGNGGRAGVQPRAPLPGRVRRAERGEPGAGDVRPADLLGLLPVDRVPRRARDGQRPLLRLAPLRPRLAHDRDADHGDRPPATRLPAAAGAVGRLWPAAVGQRGDGQDREHPRRGARHQRPARRAPLPRIEGDLDLDSSSSPTARIRSCTGSRSISRREAASRSSASRATASPRSRG